MQETLSNHSRNSNDDKLDDTTIKMPSEKKSPFAVRDKEMLGELTSTKSQRDVEGNDTSGLPKLSKRKTSPMPDNSPMGNE